MQVDPVAVLDKVFELAGQVGDLMASTLTERGLTPARAEALLVLHTSGEPMVQRQLSQALQCTPRHVTALVDALEQAGMAHRGPHPTDRRATLVTLTDLGARTAHRMAQERQSSAHQLLGHLTPAELAGFMAVADHVLRHLGHSAPPDTSPTGPHVAPQVDTGTPS
ncbi:MarR family winged helix-turn-helix transcriptional regulator [Pseudonocardia sp. GCM10023141]|uniref:MarR family winged helix-turn-helix transcriptional regulator n=1 Tax=Pseudonocardia sp. GCM10023141 TaxID=3252653 RepID=UPI00360BD28D